MTVQSAVVQQVGLGMQLLEAPQTFWPAAQPQLPPGIEQDWPVTVQSPLVQQVPIGMHVPEARQGSWPSGQLQTPPEQAWPANGQTTGG